LAIVRQIFLLEVCHWRPVLGKIVVRAMENTHVIADAEEY